MAKQPTNDTSLNIPSFLLNPTHPSVAEPNEDEVDAVMESVIEAVRQQESPEEAPEEQGSNLASAPEAAQEQNAPGDALEHEPVEAADVQSEVEGERVEPELAAEDETTGSQPAKTETQPDSDADPEPTLKEDLAALDALERHIFAHRYATSELEAFGGTIDPKNATADRAEALAVLMEEDHDRLSDPNVGSLLERLAQKSDELEPIRAAQVRVLARDRHQLVSVPAAEQAKLVRLSAESYDVWLRAKANNDWRSFAPYLDRMISLERKIARAMNPDADPYDTLLDQYEQGSNRAFYNSFFAQVKQCVVPLLSAISMSRRQLSRTCVEGRFDAARQWELARDVARLEGINEDAHYLTSTEHPFSEAMTSNYAVTAAHVVEDDVMSNVYSMLHEVGHNLYEQGVDPALNRTSLKGGTSMGMHESQSRFFENYIGRDRAFIGPLLALMKQRFPGQLSRVTPNQLYQAVNRVEPSLVRTEADELTYPLHIIVRYEIEQLLMAGEATAREVPKLWAERYRSYLGIDVPTDTQGPLQDVHWAQGMIGYFPTYAIGNAYAAQLRAKMIDEGLDWNGLLAAGDLAPIRAWLRERVWQFGRSKDPAQIIADATGEPFDCRHYTNYLTAKFSALYGLR